MTIETWHVDDIVLLTSLQFRLWEHGLRMDIRQWTIHYGQYIMERTLENDQWPSSHVQSDHKTCVRDPKAGYWGVS